MLDHGGLVGKRFEAYPAVIGIGHIAHGTIFTRQVI
jgi:hypothetical protein